ncbi:MAG: hypothetical protein AAFR64_09340 [Pseudomonadota bacterium]
MAFFLSTLAAFAPAEQTVPPSQCEAAEETVISGAVQDDLGLDVAVCLEDEEQQQRLTIRWSGEGGGDAVSCLASECQGVIEYSRHTSPHLTVLTLTWTKGGGTQKLYQSLSRPTPDVPALAQTTHIWEVAGAQAGSAESYPVLTQAAPLALIQLDALLGPNP